MSHAASPHPPLADVPHPPGASPAAVDLAKTMYAPIERFLAVSAASGIILLVVTAIALGLANSPLGPAYESLWTTPIAIELGSFRFARDVRFWVNDILMTIFFFVVGLEIRREIYRGELSEWKRASLPLFAALGGMLAPAALYAIFNAGTPSQHGWGTPMATDIAFAVGVLALLGKRVPPALRVLLLALAVIDDLGAIVVIAVFYSSGVHFAGFGVALIGLVITFVMQLFGVRPPLAYVPPAIITWAGTYAAGVHPTIAGVVVGMITPVTPWFGPVQLRKRLEHALGVLTANARPSEDELVTAMVPLKTAVTEVLSPGDRLIATLHGWVAYLIMPLFALANAGVALGSASFGAEGLRVFAGVGLGLFLGKPIGITLACWLAVKFGISKIPAGTRWRDIAIVGVVGGIGFTMAIFVAQLGFPPGELLETAKLSILIASMCAGVAGLLYGMVVLPKTIPAEAAQTASEAESSTTV